MKWSTALALLFLVTTPATAGEGGRGFGGGFGVHTNSGRIPAAPEARMDRHVEPEVEHFGHDRVNALPHVSHDHWFGHDRPDEVRYHLAKPFEFGHFDRFGPSHRYGIVRVDRDHHRFWFDGGFFFDVADWDWPLYADWCWDCGDDFVVYEDPDHVGWYLLYDVNNGQYVHTRYMGKV